MARAQSLAGERIFLLITVSELALKHIQWIWGALSAGLKWQSVKVSTAFISCQDSESMVLYLHKPHILLLEASNFLNVILPNVTFFSS